MAKHILLALILFIVLMFSFESCKKATSPNGKIKGQTYRHQFSNTTTVDTISYTYDQLGRISTIQDKNKGKATYSYTSNSYIYTPASGVPDTGILNGQGLVISSSDGYTFNYDQNGYRISSVSSDLASYYIIKDGNILVDSEVNRGNSSMQYYTHSSIVDNRDFGNSFGGKPYHNLALSDSISGGQVNNFSYTFDKQGRVITETISGNGILLTNTFSYFD